MPEPFKNQFNRHVVTGMADHFARAWPAFDATGFVAMAGDGLEVLELKQRADRITQAMEAFLPDDFPHGAQILGQSLAPDAGLDTSRATVTDEGIAGWAILPMSHYVGLRGRDHLDLAMDVLREMTSRFSSEFGIRFLILHDPKRCLEIMAGWTVHENEHVRRLVSEGSRPRLPWAMRLPDFIGDPSPVLALLERLRDDPSEYVRRSVANNLNDIAKDHPDRVTKVAARWLKGADDNRRKLVRHGLRTLVKQGHGGALAALGHGPPAVELISLEIRTPEVVLGGALEFGLILRSTTAREQSLIIDYAVHHRKANGGLRPKVFKWKTLDLAGHAEHRATRRHPMRPITTRVYHPGSHLLEILVNGQSLGLADFQLAVV